jgi:hypothetical protein
MRHLVDADRPAEDEPFISEDEGANRNAALLGPTERRPSSAPPQRAIVALLTLMLLVNLAASLYQLPLNRVVERRLCREYYAVHDPSLIAPDGHVEEKLCKVDEVQQGLAWIQGVMETAWIVGGKPIDHVHCRSAENADGGQTSL